MRKSTILWLFLAITCGVLLFHTSQKVVDGQEKLSALEKNISTEDESLRVLSAEWSYLNKPERLEKLARQHLKLEPMKGRQFVTLQNLPDTPPQVEPVADSATTGKAAADPAAAEKTAGSAVTEKTSIKKTEAAPALKIIQPPTSSPLATTALPAPTAKTKKQLPAAAQNAPQKNFSDLIKNLGVR